MALALAVLLAIGSLLPVRASAPSNTDTAKRVFLEKMDKGRFDRLDEIYAREFIAHSASGDYSLEEDNASGKEWRKAFPDLHVTVARTVAQDDMVALHWQAAGTNSVAAAGTPGKGKTMHVEGMTFFRFKEGRIVEEWSLIDIASMQRQLE